ncbi:hypothetical protein Baya_6336 [Bagarius yarrelli]|uniref:Uncharacterized protein n=1 Tax=Bagarius yarrelli TaxID=175774 RepID=A0A556TY16_BAGYA|nr:hypothetical protein Baya_6336 [Bagarius yarrelli]
MLTMSSLIKEAMIESYALMILVMATFFVYFCGMVWAFSNPKLSDTEDEQTTSECGSQTELCVRHEELRECERYTPGGTQECLVMLDIHTYSGYVNDFYDVD